MTLLSRPRSPQYKVSAVLSGHTDDVRSLSAASSSSLRLFSSSRDGTARSWVCEREGTWVQEEEWSKAHEGFINCVASFERPNPPSPSPSRIRDEGKQRYLLTAGSDSLIQVYSTSESSKEPIQTLLGHSHNVCCLDVDKKGTRIASGSWDTTARVWNAQTWETESVLTDHNAAVWDVLFLDDDDDDHQDDLCLTAAADNLVRLYKRDTVQHTYKGHTGPVRALSRVLPDDSSSKLFASASNDGTIRIWNYSTGDALTVLNHQDFVYSLVSIPSINDIGGGGGLASSGEDGLIKIWNEVDGQCDQVINVPALSVWSLAVLENGDLACACSDKMIWIFTRTRERQANRDVLDLYESRLLEARKPKRVEGKSSELPTISARADLDQPGQTLGEVKLVRESKEDTTIAFRWSGSTWERLGQVVDPRPVAAKEGVSRDKMVQEGAQFDFVFQIDVRDDSPLIPLPYNLDDDVYEVAKTFVEVNKLPESYLDQIVAFVRSNTR